MRGGSPYETNGPGHQVRRLEEADLEGLLAIRREALEREPAAFSASPGDDVGLDPEFVRRVLGLRDEQAVFGVVDGGALVGMVGVRRLPAPKEAHRAHLWGMYVRASHRGRGLGLALLSAAVGFARSLPGATSLELEVSEPAHAARRLYERFGFTAWGVEPAALVVDGVPIDVHRMTLRLTDRGP